MLSVYSNHLTHGFYCANGLETIARHYVLIADLVEHYRREMTLKYLAIRYEDIVDDQEANIRRMLAFVGTGFDKRCLKFHENKRYARTASYAQVTEKLYDSSRYPLSPLPEAFEAGHPDPGAGDHAPGLHDRWLIRLPAFTAAPAPSVSKTIDQWRADAEEHEKAGRLEEAEGAADPDHQCGAELSPGAASGRDPVLQAQAAAGGDRPVRACDPSWRRTWRSITATSASSIAANRSWTRRSCTASARGRTGADGPRVRAYNLGVIHYDRLEIDASDRIDAPARSNSIPPRPRRISNWRKVCCSSGQFEEGWKEYEYRFDLPNAPPAAAAQQQAAVGRQADARTAR